MNLCMFVDNIAIPQFGESTHHAGPSQDMKACMGIYFTADKMEVYILDTARYFDLLHRSIGYQYLYCVAK